MVKSNKIVKWGGSDTTIIPKMVDDIKGQNSALSEQEKIQGRLLEIEEKITKAKKGAKAGDEASLKLYRELIAERKKLQQLLKIEEQSQSSLYTLTSLTDKMQKSIRGTVTEIKNEEDKTTKIVRAKTMAYYKTNQATHGFMENILGIGDLQESINANINNAKPLLESNSQAIKNQGMDYVRLIQGSEENLDLTMKLAENYDNIGGSDFQDQTKEAETLLKQRIRERDYIKNVLRPSMTKALQTE